MKISGRKKMKLVLGMLIAVSIICIVNAISYSNNLIPAILFYVFVYIGINGSEKNQRNQKLAGIIGCSFFGLLMSKFNIMGLFYSSELLLLDLLKPIILGPVHTIDIRDRQMI